MWHKPQAINQTPNPELYPVPMSSSANNQTVLIGAMRLPQGVKECSFRLFGDAAPTEAMDADNDGLLART